MPRRRIERNVTVLESRGVFGSCSCGEKVLYYSDQGVKCSVCGKLYGVWYERKPKRVIIVEEL